MIQVDCPFCEEPLALELAVIQAPSGEVRCDGCSVAVEVETLEDHAMALAA